MNEQERKTKNAQIKETVHNTLERHSKQRCRTYTCKINKKKLKPVQAEALKMIFIEAKWLWNYILDWSEKTGKKISQYPEHQKEITHKDKDMNDVPVTLKYMSSQPKQSLKKRMLSNMKTLKTLKNKGYQLPGKLKFKSEVNIIDLKQFGNSHKITGRNKMRIAGVPKDIRVLGLSQFIDKDVEIANARLIKRGSNYYVQIVTYEDPKQEWVKDEEIGCDLGCNPSYALSNGFKDLVLIQETERLKRLQKKLARQVKGSKGYYKTCTQIRDENAKIVNRRNDKANKLVHELLKYRTVIIQDEQLKAWHKNGHGKAIQHSILGRVKAKLLEHSYIIDAKELSKHPWVNDYAQVVILPKHYPTTKLCRECGQYHDELRPWDKVFKCDCGMVEDRDIHAARNMVWFYRNIVSKLGMERADVKRVEMQALVKEVLASGCQLVSGKLEAPSL